MAAVVEGLPILFGGAGYFYAWSRGGIFASMNYTPVMASRQAAGREASPTAGVIDSQSVNRKRWPKGL
jgi:hypothetical protein